MSPTAATIVYCVFALGAAAVYFALPGRSHHKPVIAALLGLAALTSLCAVLALRWLSDDPTRVYFLFFSVVALAAAVRVITHTKPVYSALYFVVVVVASSALLLLLRAEFLAIAVIIIYGGAILVTYLFVIMLSQQSGAPAYDRTAREPFVATAACFALMAAIAGAAASERPKASAVLSQTGAQLTSKFQGVTSAADNSAVTGDTKAIGQALMTRYIVAVQIAGILLLISMVGAIALARKHVPPGPTARVRGVLGEVGKGVQPF